MKREFKPTGNRNQANQESPCAVGSVHEVEIVDVIEDGDGIGRIEGFTIFVKGAVPGDKARVRVDKVKKKLAFGTAVAILTPSEWRTTPPCPVFSTCGGCTLQNLTYEKQLQIKGLVVESAIRRIGGISEGIVHPCMGMTDPWRYRNKAMMPIGKGGVIGFYKQGSHVVVDVRDCLLQQPVVGLVAESVREFIKETGTTVYEEKRVEGQRRSSAFSKGRSSQSAAPSAPLVQGTGLVRHLVVRSNDQGQVMAVLVLNGNSMDENKSVAEVLEKRLVDALKNIPGMAAIHLNFNKFNDSRIMGYDSKCIWGAEKLTDRICGFEFEISPVSFLQVNSIQAEVLYGKALDYAGLTGEETVFDLYSGIGTITLALAKKAKRAIGVELVKEAVLDAKANAERNSVSNVGFYDGKVEEVLLDLRKVGVKADVVVLDPPRNGCEPIVMETILKMAPKRVVYVSCKASTMARDIKVLVENGYSFVEATPVDLFPHSAHVECVVKLERKNG